MLLSPGLRKCILVAVLCFMTVLTLTTVFDIRTLKHSLGGGTGTGALSLEGYSGMGNTDNPLMPAIVPPYNTVSNLYNIYGLLYYDSNNGNIVEAVVDSNGIMKSIVIVGRDASVNPHRTTYSANDAAGNAISQNTKESLVSSIVSVDQVWSYMTSDRRLQIVYIPFYYDTYIHIFDLQSQSGQPALVYSVYFQNGGTNNGSYQWNSSSPVSGNLPVISSVYSGASDPNDGQMVLEPFYDTSKNLVQFSKYVKLDVTNGNMVVQSRLDPNKRIDVYQPSGNINFYTPSNNASQSGIGSTPDSALSTFPTNTNTLTPMLINDVLGTNFVIYWPINNVCSIVECKSVVDSINGCSVVTGTVWYTSSSSSYSSLTGSSSSSQPVTAQLLMSSLQQQQLMQAEAALAASMAAAASSTSSDGIQTYSTLAEAMAAAAANDSSFNPTSTVDMSDEDKEWKWYWYWRMLGIGGNDSNSISQMNDKYLLKTQIVPPVFPACPTANASLWPYYYNASGGVLPLPQYQQQQQQQQLGLASGAGLGVAGLGVGIGAGVAGLGRGVGGAIYSGVDATGRLVNNVVSGAEHGVGAVWNKLTGPTTAAGGYASGSPNNNYYVSGGGGGGGGSGYGGGGGGGGVNGAGYGYRLDPYSYNGQLSGGGSSSSGGMDPMPVTADFSQFGR